MPWGTSRAQNAKTPKRRGADRAQNAKTPKRVVGAETQNLREEQGADEDDSDEEEKVNCPNLLRCGNREPEWYLECHGGGGDR